MKKILTFILLAAIACSLMSVPVCADGLEEKVYELTILDEERQTINGWGIHLTEGADKTKYFMQASYAASTKELGATINRAFWDPNEVMNEDGTLNEKEADRYYYNHIYPAIACGIPDYAMTVERPAIPFANFAPNGRATYPDEESEDKMVKFVTDYFLYMKSKGYVLPVAFNIMNEPANFKRYVVGEQYVRFIKKYKKSFIENGLEEIRLVGPDAAGLEWVDANVGESLAYFDADPEYAEALDIVSYHAYGSTLQEETSQKFAKGLEKYPDKEVWQTEISQLVLGDGLNKKYENFRYFAANNMITALIADIAWLRVNTWFYFDTIDRSHRFLEDGTAYSNNAIRLLTFLGTGWGTNTSTSFLKTPLYNALQLIYNNVPVGSVVHRVYTDDPEHYNRVASKGTLVAFDCDDHTVLLVVNTTKNEKTYNINNLKGKSAEINTISQDNSDTVVKTGRNIVDGSIKNFVLKPDSINIIVTKNEDFGTPEVTIDSDKDIFIVDGIRNSRNDSITLAGSVDEHAKVTINGKSVKLDKNNKFAYPVTLSNGEIFTISAIDKEGNKSSKVVEYNYNPSYTGLKLEQHQANITSSEYVIKGIANCKSTIRCGEFSVQTKDDNSFELKIKVPEGQNDFEVVAVDENNNKSDALKVSINCDSVVPDINLETNGGTTNLRRYVLKGNVSEKLSSLKVNGVDISVDENLTFSDAVKVSEGTNTLKLTATDLMGNISEKEVSVEYTKDSFTPHKVNGTAYTRYATSGVKLDGKLEETDWKLDLIADKVVEGSMDNINIFGTLWDEENLYIAAKVKDTDIRFEDVNPYQNDCVEIFLNPSNNKDGAFEPLDRQLWSAYVDNDKSVLYKNKYPFNSAWNFTKDGYTVEIAIPWSSMELTASDGLKLGFDLAVNDNDIGGNKRRGVATWCGSNLNYNDTSMYGTLVLTKSSDITYEDTESDYTAAPKEPVEAEHVAIDLSINGTKVEGGTIALLIGDKPYVTYNVFNKLGIVTSWGEFDTIDYTYNGKKYTFWPDRDAVYVNDKAVDVKGDKPYRSDDELYIPVKFMNEYLGITAVYDSTTKTVNITE